MQTRVLFLLSLLFYFAYSENIGYDFNKGSFSEDWSSNGGFSWQPSIVEQGNPQNYGGWLLSAYNPGSWTLDCNVTLVFSNF